MIKLSIGTNGAILTNSKYYRAMFYYAIGMAVSVIVLNKILIQMMGIQGAALATFLVVALFSVLKILYVRARMQLQPYTAKTIKLLVLILMLFLMFKFIELPLNPFLSILIKSVLLGVLFVFFVIRLKLSDDMNLLYRKFLRT
jgi:O-antigen/teichoic acid export membrane protein